MLGKEYEGFPEERWLDIRRIDLLAPILRARIDACRAKGFDGVDPDNLNGFENDTGFPLTATDQLRFNTWLANEAHARELSIGLKNDGPQAGTLAPYFDWVIVEECIEQRDCGEYAPPFTRAGKPIFEIEYRKPTRRTCAEARRRRISVAFKTPALRAPRKTCTALPLRARRCSDDARRTNCSFARKAAVSNAAAALLNLVWSGTRRTASRSASGPWGVSNTPRSACMIRHTPHSALLPTRSSSRFGDGPRCSFWTIPTLSAVLRLAPASDCSSCSRTTVNERSRSGRRAVTQPPESGPDTARPTRSPLSS